jgi:hypothetical protein
MEAQALDRLAHTATGPQRRKPVGRRLHFSGEAGTEVGCGIYEAHRTGHRYRFFLLNV